MKAIQQDEPSNSFVLRIWREAGDAPPNWRGHVTHAVSGSAMYIECLVDLQAFLEAFTGPLAKTRDGEAARPRG